MTEGCLKKTCKGGVWRSSIAREICCFNGKAFNPGSTISTATGPGCASAVLRCELEDGLAKTMLQDQSTCGGYATVEQVQEIKEMLEDYFAGKIYVSAGQHTYHHLVFLYNLVKGKHV